MFQGFSWILNPRIQLLFCAQLLQLPSFGSKEGEDLGSKGNFIRILSHIKKWKTQLKLV